MNINEYVVRNGGSVDVEASVAKFTAALAVHLVERETEQATIASAVHTVFDKNMGNVVPMPALTGLSLQELNAQPENFTALSERVLEYVRENSKGDSSLFIIAKGKGGGVRRRVDIPAPAAK